MPCLLVPTCILSCFRLSILDNLLTDLIKIIEFDPRNMQEFAPFLFGFFTHSQVLILLLVLVLFDTVAFWDFRIEKTIGQFGRTVDKL